MSKLVYLDNAATTRVLPEVAEVALACMLQDFGNPSSAHRLGIAASARLKQAREEVLEALGDERGELGDVIWTSGGTEADALGVMGAARALAGRGRRIVLSAIEHPAVFGAAEKLTAEGFEPIVVPVDWHGVVSVQAVVDAVTDGTVVVACMLANNELGTLQPVAEIARAVKSKRRDVHVHCDAVQGFGKIPFSVRTLGVDSLAISGHKIHAPKGVGALWLRKGARLVPLWSGGGQQKGMRSGTENVPGIAAFGAAARIATRRLAEDRPRMEARRERLEREILRAGIGAVIHGADAPRLPNIASIGFPGVPSEPLLHALEGRGVYVSAGSACASASHGPSHVLKAIGVGADVGTLRFSLSRETSDEDIAYAAQVAIDEARALTR